MPGKHTGHPTISFRPHTSGQIALIEERARLSGMSKKDFYCKSIIYSNICVTGTKENITTIVNAVYELQMVMKEIASQIEACNLSLSNESYYEIKEDFLALCINLVDILNGAAYLFDREVPEEADTTSIKQEMELSDFRKMLDRER